MTMADRPGQLGWRLAVVLAGALSRMLVTLAVCAVCAGCSLRAPVPAVPSGGQQQPLASLAAWDAATDDARVRAVESWIGSGARGLVFARLEDFACGGVEHRMAVVEFRPIGAEMVVIPGGRYEIGSPESESFRSENENRHPVVLGPFAIARHEVTNAAWGRIFGNEDDPIDDPNLGNDAPTAPRAEITWTRAREFCARIGAQLPTEAEWEVACRGGSQESWYWGPDPARFSEYAALTSWRVISSPHLPDRARRVATLRGNAFGLHDMIGNVAEYTSDTCSEGGPRAYGLAEAEDDPSPMCIVRGGSSRDIPEFARCATRVAEPPNVLYPSLGFRVVVR